MTRQLQPCGTDAAYRRHRYNGEDPCAECHAARNREQREYNWSNGIHQERVVAECGTVSAWNRHQYRNEPTDALCRQAHAEDMKRWHYNTRLRARRGRIPDVIDDYVETYGPLELRELVLLIQERHEMAESSIRRAANRMMSDGRLRRGVDIVVSAGSAATLNGLATVPGGTDFGVADSGRVA